MKHQISIAVDKDDYQVLSAAGVNISDLVNDAIGRKARRIKAEGWKTSPDLSQRMFFC
ncbi:type II toxin-antitoxin system CcdA family antitoxin [Pectobacterium atrosepticum]|uniref:type II toxin-antitoxin system CcdA family antitoxin n=1 Tax=Pectobacterium atrosepticum TaxID=29471 RepID=UPI00039A6449